MIILSKGKQKYEARLIIKTTKTFAYKNFLDVEKLWWTL